MQILKLIGGMLLLAACFGVSHYFSVIEKKRMERVRDLIHLIRYIKDKVDCYSMPIDKIFDACGGDILLKLGIEEKVRDLSELFGKLENTCDSKSEKILYELAGNFGKGYREHQMRLCDIAVSALERHLGVLESTYPMRKKRLSTLCFSIGGMLLIALL